MAVPTRSTRSSCWSGPPSAPAMGRVSHGTADRSYPPQMFHPWDATLGAFDVSSSVWGIRTIQTIAADRRKADRPVLTCDLVPHGTEQSTVVFKDLPKFVTSL